MYGLPPSHPGYETARATLAELVHRMHDERGLFQALPRLVFRQPFGCAAIIY